MPQIVRFELENYRSVQDAQELSFVASRISDEPSHLLPIPGSTERLLPVIGLYGANASGKSTLLAGLAWGLGLVRDSQRLLAPSAPVGRQPFLLDSESRTAATRWQLEFLHEGVRYEYGFAITERVEEEWLLSFPHKKPRVLFERVAGEPVKFGRHLTGARRRAEAFVRPNSLLLSAAAQNGHPLLGGIASGLAQDIAFGPVDLAAVRRMLGTSGAPSLAGLLRVADVGIGDVRLAAKDPGIDPEAMDRLTRLFLEESEGLGALVGPEGRHHLRVLQDLGPDKIKEELSSSAPAILGRLEFGHVSGDGGLHFLPVEAESHGTIAYLRAGVAALKVLATGGVLCLDELDSSLHPLLARSVVLWFQTPALNKMGAQLLFTTHDANLLSPGVLRRDQVWFTEKDQGGATHAYPLTDIKTRKGDNLQRGYLEGRFGAIPHVTGLDEEAP